MSNGIANKLGNWRYADGARAEKAFGGRLFTIIIAGALDQGIVGSEMNGIAIFDENLFNVVMTLHAREASGYDGPSKRQIEEFNRILAMDWTEFTAFLRSSPNYGKGSLPDINDPVPLTFKPEKDRMIFPPSAKDADCPYEFPLETKREIIDFLCNHKKKPLSPNSRNQSLAWDMKAHNFDTSGRSEGYAPNTEFDERWKEYVEDNYDLLWTVASDQLRQFTEKEYTAYPGVGAGDYEFAIAGHSGEWLVLTKVEGIGALQWPWMGPMVSDLQGWSDEDLVKFYKLVVQIDKDVENPEAAMAEGYSAHRAMMEEEWKAELRSSPSAQR